MSSFGQISTPPTASTRPTKPPKPISTKWSIRMPVSFSTVLHQQLRPAVGVGGVDLLASPWPGIDTIESRGIDISRFGPEPVCRIMIVSVRWPAALPVPSSLRSSADQVAARVAADHEVRRAGLVVGPVAVVLGKASTLSTFDHAHSGTATRKTTHSSSRTNSQRQPRAGEAPARPGPPPGGGAGVGAAPAGSTGRGGALTARPAAGAGAACCPSRRSRRLAAAGARPGWRRAAVRALAALAVEPVVLRRALLGAPSPRGRSAWGDGTRLRSGRRDRGPCSRVSSHGGTSSRTP